MKTALWRNRRVQFAFAAPEAFYGLVKSIHDLWLARVKLPQAQIR